MNLNDAQTLINDKLSEFDLLEKGWKLAWGNAKVVFGSCHYRTKTIRMSRPLVEVNSEAVVMETVLHEIAHALAGPGTNHGPEWRAIAHSIGSVGDRTWSPSDVVEPPSKYTVTCPVCGNSYGRNRRSKHTISCGKCSPVFDSRFILTWTEN